MRVVTYEEALAWIYSIGRSSGGTPRALAAPAALLAKLGDPQQQFKSVHIAGTKGKGSTSAMLASCLLACGAHTGLFTSPHLHSFCERIQVDGRPITREALAALAVHVREAAQGITGLVTFDVITAIGFLYFAAQRVEWAVVEAGLGGGLDSTNVLLPRACVITSISLDHQEFLGDTLAKIAGEKAGIIKPGVPVIVHTQPAEVMPVIERAGREQNAPVIWLGRHWRWATLNSLQNRDSSISNTRGSVLGPAQSLNAQSFEIKQVAFKRSDETPFPNDLEGYYDVTLLGKHQLDNATGVVATLDALRRDPRNGLRVNAATVRNGLHNTRWPGRFEVLRQEPPVIIDGAHNVDSVNKFVMTLGEYFSGRRWLCVFGCFSDKDAEGMLRALAPRVGRWLFVQPAGPRARSSAELLALATRLGLRNTSCASDVRAAIDQARTSRDPVCVTGSLMLVGEARAAWGGFGIDAD